MKSKLVGALLALPLLAATASAQEGGVSITEVSGAITEATNHAKTIGGAGMALIGVFVVFKLVRRAANRLT